jgi:hypothetical protein
VLLWLLDDPRFKISQRDSFLKTDGFQFHQQRCAMAMSSRRGAIASDRPECGIPVLADVAEG